MEEVAALPSAAVAAFMKNAVEEPGLCFLDSSFSPNQSQQDNFALGLDGRIVAFLGFSFGPARRDAGQDATALL